MVDDLLAEVETNMRKAVEALRLNLLTIRTGRASPSLVERLPVDYYGSVTPLNQLASISSPEPRLLTIRPWDPSSLAAIERAIQASNLGLTPLNDGKIIRLPIPRLTQERRRELAKIVRQRVEEGRVAVRHSRRDGLRDLQELQDEKLISEDDFYRAKEDIQKVTDSYVEKADELGTRKEEEVMEV